MGTPDKNGLWLLPDNFDEHRYHIIRVEKPYYFEHGSYTDIRSELKDFDGTDFIYFIGEL
jgi:hypothetical protein